MKQYCLEIVRQKWRLLGIILFLLLLNTTLSAVISSYQIPSLTELQARWNSLRRQSALGGQLDATALFRQGSEDLKKLEVKIPEKRQFARVLSDLFETASSSAVEIGTLSYKPVQIKEEPLLSYQLSLSVSGGYAAVKSFLADLQNNPELMVVDTVTFSNSDLFIENVIMDLRITIYLKGGA